MCYAQLQLNKENNGQKASVDKGKLIAKSASMPNLIELVEVNSLLHDLKKFRYTAFHIVLRVHI